MSVPTPSCLRRLRLFSVTRYPRAHYTGHGRTFRHFHALSRLDIVKPFLLADIGEGITECQLIQWFVQPGARVEQFDKICEVQSDKASVEITSPFDGVIKKLYYEPDDMAITGRPLVDIDIQSEISPADEAKLASGGASGGSSGERVGRDDGKTEREESQGGLQVDSERVSEDDLAKPRTTSEDAEKQSQPRSPRQTHGGISTLATPAIRHLTKELNVDITEIEGSGKDGRVLKEDVHRFVSQRDQQQPITPQRAPTLSRDDQKVQLTPVQMQMFRTMTRALNIPHFLYSCAADVSAITTLRQRLKSTAATEPNITHLAFILKAVSLAFQHHPLLNSSLDTKDPEKPELTRRGAHNFGVAIDAPSGLLVPVVKNAQNLTIIEIAIQLRQLSEKARQNKLAPSDFSGATFTISNIGSIGGGVVAPVISEPQVAILGVGRSKLVPAFDKNEELVKKEEVVLNWSADHRVVDGAECARCAERVRGYLEDPSTMMVGMR